MKFVKKYTQNYYKNGIIEWIGLREIDNECVKVVKTAELLVDHGLVGDKAGKRKGSRRQVTLIQAEHLNTIAAFLGKETIEPEDLRRNIVVSGFNLSVLKGSSIKICDAILTITGNCAPCHKMEEKLGYGGYNAMRNLGGVTAIIEKGGLISVGDEVEVLSTDTAQGQLL